jgi:ABC-type Fe3+ transport system substrate-binding protein
VVTDDHHANLWSRKLHLPFDYKLLGVEAKVIQHDNGSIVVVHGFYPPAYNIKVLAAKDVPKRWEDLLDPKWNDGRLGVSSATHHLARLAVGPWGEKKTTEFVKALEKQRPYLGTLAELYTRLQLGEVLISVTLGDNMLARAKKTGAPVVPVKEIEPVVSAAVNAGVLKGSEHPNAGHLMAAFLTTPEAQNILEEYLGQTSAYIPGTTAYKFAKERQVLFMGEKDAALVNKLSEEYAKILGFLGK